MLGVGAGAYLATETDIAYIGTRTHYGGREAAFGLHPEDRGHHLYIIGKTGVGKTSLLENLILQDIAAGRAVAVIDPHGDLSVSLLDKLPRHHSERVLYFHAADLDFPIAFNPLHGVPDDRKHLVVSGIVESFKSIWSDSWGPRLEYILSAAISALLDCHDATLLGLPRLLTDEWYRQWVIKQIKDPVVKTFWEDEFSQYDKRFRTEAIAPILNKAGQLFMSPILRNILGQVRSRIKPRYLMDNRKIFIANLSKGLMGEDKANLLGALIINAFQLAAMSRADIPETERQDFSLYVDEFQSFTTTAFVPMLAESRKYRISLSLCNQFTAQIPPELQAAIFGNVGTILSFRIGQQDAEKLSREFGKAFAPHTFTELDNYTVLVKQQLAGQQLPPFMAKTWPPLGTATGRHDAIIRRSRERFATRRDVVEDRINRWLAQ